ncbi:MAG: hypothetical protein KA212_02785 [Burkholderiaceae bacterium]|nr:hypothetical protein [Xylophilus sp.]MBP6559202.1 hypothetical protein [Burkholderiaceae bacterium]MBP6617339.1 hypothetical protein [Burkholderiaceae bacterium]MBP6651932.1 hypothetical protein [Xylophilus sp.]MBP7421264.1 hypothetical protein [Burkholderiaceae bacterium]
MTQFLLNAAPQPRGLDSQRTAAGAQYWTFPADFYDRVLRLVGPQSEMQRRGRARP